MPLLAQSIRRARLEAQLSVNDLAACLEISPETLVSWEYDLDAPARENLIKLSLQFPDLLGTLQETKEQ